MEKFDTLFLSIPSIASRKTRRRREKNCPEIKPKQMKNCYSQWTRGSYVKLCYSITTKKRNEIMTFAFTEILPTTEE